MLLAPAATRTRLGDAVIDAGGLVELALAKAGVKASTDPQVTAAATLTAGNIIGRSP
jgi:hypothetical protein